MDGLAQTLPADVMDRVRGFPFLETEAEVVEFIKFCETSDFKVLKGNPMALYHFTVTPF